jgi:hypothetical protein
MNAPMPPHYVTSLEEIFWGGTLVAITMLMHGFGMLLVLRTNGRLKERFDQAPSFMKGMFVLILASWMVLLVHLLEVFAWAGFFLCTNAVNTTTDARADASLCYYFALMDYTTLGSSYNLHLRWRLLEGMIAVAGLLTFAWSTGIMLTLAQEFQDQQMTFYKRRREHRKNTSTAPNLVSSPGAAPGRQMQTGL